MQNDCDIYVDPDEDEVFFGCMSEREKNVCSKLVKCAETDLTDCKFSLYKTDDENVTNLLKSEQSTKTIINEVVHPIESAKNNDLENLGKSDDSIKILSTNSSVELDHSYSTPMKHKIDKSILTTPKSVVKADKDGGFLKVLSEIALVKAEAEGNKELEEKEDEDKENKIVQCIPEIKITEATPEKGNVLSPPKSIKTEIRRFRIIYNSPQSDDNIDYKAKSHSDSFGSEKYMRNKCLDQEVNRDSNNEERKSADFTDMNESNILNEGFLLKEGETEDLIVETNKDSTNDNNSDSEVVVLNEEKSIHEILQDVKLTEEPEAEKLTGEVKSFESLSASKETHIPAQKSLRFSKEVKKIVEVLKKSTVDDTLNFTIPEMDLENENSFLYPSPVPALDDTVILNNGVKTPLSKVKTENKPQLKSKTVEKERNKPTPAVSRSRGQPLRFFSERKLNRQVGNEAIRCVKKLPLEERKTVTVEKVNGGGAKDCNTVPISRIPVFGSKNSKIPVSDRLARPLTSKSTPSRITSAKNCKNPKFNHIESPINAYIHNKPTSLVQNVKPELKKDALSKVWKLQTAASTTKLPEKTSASAIRLPFVEYKSGTPYKIEKRSESRLPRLAPTVLKLIGSNSPKVLKHEGRFYLKTPRKQGATENSTVVAEANEVSVVLSHPAQKSCTFK